MEVMKILSRSCDPGLSLKDASRCEGPKARFSIIKLGVVGVKWHGAMYEDGRVSNYVVGLSVKMVRSR